MKIKVRHLKMEEDRISQLPDVILQHIISSVDIQQAVQTTILSKRWRNLWSSLSDLDFNYRRLAARSGVDVGSPFDSQTFMQRFTHFADQFLSRRDHTSPIRKFQLSSSYLIHIDPRFLDKFVEYAINHGVRHLDIEVMCHYDNPFNFPVAFSGCQTLQLLRLRPSGCSIIIPKTLALPNLHTLFLENFSFTDDEDDHFNDYNFSREPFSRFPNLENLYLQRCGISGLIISAPKLKILEISSLSLLTYRQTDVERIFSPALTSFKYEEYFPLECSNMNFPLLEEACVNIYANCHILERKTFLDCVGMLQQLGNAKLLTVTLDTLEVLEFDPQFLERSPCPVPKMECLKVTERSNVGYVVNPKKTVLEGVMNYLTKGCLCGDNSMVVKLPEGVSVIQKEADSETNLLEDEDEDDEMGLRGLFTPYSPPPAPLHQLWWTREFPRDLL